MVKLIPDSRFLCMQVGWRGPRVLERRVGIRHAHQISFLVPQSYLGRFTEQAGIYHTSGFRVLHWDLACVMSQSPDAKSLLWMWIGQVGIYLGVRVP